MSLSHKTLFSLAAKTQKVCLSFKEDITVPIPLVHYIVLFFSHFSLANIFFSKTFGTGFLYGTNIFGRCQIALKTLLKWQHPVRNMTLLYSLLLREDDVSPTESKNFPLIPICKFTLSPLWLLQGLPWKKRKFWESRLDRSPPKKSKSSKPCMKPYSGVSQMWIISSAPMELILH